MGIIVSLKNYELMILIHIFLKENLDFFFFGKCKGIPKLLLHTKHLKGSNIF